MKSLTRALLLASLAYAQPSAAGEASGDPFATHYVRFGTRESEGLLYTPAAHDARYRVALVYMHPSGNNLAEPLGPQMARRGHVVLMLNHHGDADANDDVLAATIAQGIRYLRAQPGIARVVLVGHSGGGHLAAFYQNVAENGPAACSGPEKIYPCDKAAVTGLEKADGIVLLDPTLGAFHQANAIDPAVKAEAPARRDPVLDMFAPANGYAPADQSAHYSADFISRFDAAQAARSTAITEAARERLRLIEAGKGLYRDDEPLVVPGMGNLSAGARLYQPDTGLLAHTRGRYATLRADGSTTQGPILSIRSPLGNDSLKGLGTLRLMTRTSTVRGYLGSAAIRFRPDFAIRADTISGVEWESAFTSTPANARGITVPALVLTMTCHYLVVPGEIIFDNLASRDKTMQGIEGATHVFQPCRPQYGDTLGRTFDAVGAWLEGRGRF